MAEKNEARNEGWFNSWLNAAKNKSTEVLEFVKKDLEEFGTAVKNEASSVAASAGSVMEKTLNLESPDSTVNNVKRSFSTFLGQVNTVLNPSPDDSDTEMLIVENSETVNVNKFQKALYELQKDPETYLCDPDPQLRKQYECWLEILDDQLSDDRIAKHVNSSEVLKRHYAKLVPDILEHQLFWKRYLFKKALLEDEIARQEILEKREQQKEKELLQDKGGRENVKWEQEDFSADIELTEEEQIRILEQYENETKQKRKSQSNPSEEMVHKNKNRGDGNRSRGDGDETNVADDERPGSSANKNEADGKNVDESETDLTLRQKLSKVDSAVGPGTPNSSNCSTDDDWEKVSDVEK